MTTPTNNTDLRVIVDDTFTGKTRTEDLVRFLIVAPDAKPDEACASIAFRATFMSHSMAPDAVAAGQRVIRFVSAWLRMYADPNSAKDLTHNANTTANTPSRAEALIALKAELNDLLHGTPILTQRPGKKQDAERADLKRRVDNVRHAIAYVESQIG